LINNKKIWEIWRNRCRIHQQLNSLRRWPITWEK